MKRLIQRIFTVSIAAMMIVPANSPLALASHVHHHRASQKLAALTLTESTIPSYLQSMPSAKLETYFNSLQAANISKTKNPPQPVFTAAQLVEWGKQELIPQQGTVNPSQALAFFDYAIVVQPSYQPAHFWCAIALLATDPKITAQLQSLGIVDPTTDAVELKPHLATINSIFLPQYQALDNDEVQDIAMAQAQLKDTNTSFSDDMTFNNNTVHLDYGAVLFIQFYLDMLDFQARLANVYSAGDATITRDVVINQNSFIGVVSYNNINALWNDLLNDGYIDSKGVVQDAFWSLTSYTSMKLDAIFTSDKQAIYNTIKNTKATKFAADPQEILNLYPSLLTLQSMSATELTAAKNDLIAMANSYSSLSSYVQTQDQEKGYNYFVSLYTPAKPANQLQPSQYLKDKPVAQADDTAISDLLANIKNNLTNPAKYPTVVIPNEPLFGNASLNGPMVDLASLFNAPKNARSYEQSISSETNKYRLIPNNFANPTLGGLLPNASAADLNYFFRLNKQDIGYAVYVVPPVYKTPSVELMLQPLSSSSIVKQEIYRSTTPTVNNTSQKIATLSPNRPAVYVDSTIESTVTVYYYRLYTYYTFSDGTTGTTYGKVIKVSTVQTVPSQAPALFEIPAQMVAVGKPLQFTVTAVDSNNNPVTLNAALTNGKTVSTIGAKFTFSTYGNTTTGIFSWNPATNIGNGVLTVVFTAFDNQGKSASTIADVVIQPNAQKALVKLAAL